MNSPCVVDASAILALLNEETGAATVEKVLLEGACTYISTVNLAEIVTKLVDLGLSANEVQKAGISVEVKVIR